MKSRVGRIRVKLAALLSRTFDVTVQAEDIEQMNAPRQRELGLARWGVYVKPPGRNTVWVHC